jgi:transposase
METSRAAVPVVKLAPDPEVEAKRRRRSVQERRRIVEETLAPGASVARIARAYGVNANQVFYWRTLYRRGRLGAPAAETALLPVTIAEKPVSAVPAGASVALAPAECESTPSQAQHSASSTIHIQLPNAQLRIEGSADASTLRVVLEALRG